MNDTQQSEVRVYSVGLCFASVCTNASDDEVTREVNVSHPTGVGPWMISDEAFADGSPNPTPCPDDDGFRHVLLNC